MKFPWSLGSPGRNSEGSMRNRHCTAHEWERHCSFVGLMQTAGRVGGGFSMFSDKGEMVIHGTRN